MAAPPWGDWFEREELIGQISDIRVQNLQVERELVQKRTFTRWMNLHLQKCDPPIEVHDLFQDIQDGHILMALLEELSGCRLLHGFKKSSHRIFRLNNIAKVLSFLEERNVKLVSIDAANVADGNSSIILGLIWNIILFFQIKELTGNIRSQFPSCSSLSSLPTSSDSDVSICSTPSDERPSAASVMRDHSRAIKKLLQWVQKRTRKYGVTVHDFGRSWKSGLAFLAVIKSIDPTLVDMSKAFLRSARENLEDAFHIAHYSLGIPRLLDPEDVTISAPDEQSIITYVSQFLEHFPGLEEADGRQQPIERSTSIGRLNFSDGYVDALKHETLGSTEKSHRFQECRTKCPKILISSLSEDKSARSPNFRVAPKRTWSSENIASRYSTCQISRKPEISSCQDERLHTNSSDGFPSVTSADSWDQGEAPASCENSSLPHSSTGWDIYHAIPVEVTSVDEGFISPMDDRPPEELSMTESYTDVGIYSLSSLESSQEGIHCDKNTAAEELTEDVTDLLHHKAVQSVSAQSWTESRLQTLVGCDETSSEVLEEGGLPEHDEEPLSKESPEDKGEGEELEKNVCEDATESSTLKEAEEECGAESLQREPEWDHTRSSETAGGLPSDTLNRVSTEKERYDDFSKPAHVSNQNSLSEVSRVGGNSDMSNNEGATRTFLDLSVPLISISLASQELQREGMSDSEDSCTAGASGVDQGHKRDLEHSSSSAERNPRPDGSSCFELEDGNQAENVCDEDDRSSETLQQNTQECLSAILDSEAEPRDLSSPSAETETGTQPVSGHLSTDVTDQPQRKESLSSEDPTTQQEAPQAFTSRSHDDVTPPFPPSGNISSYQPILENGSPPEDVRSSPMEPMDLFYPDSEELLFTEPRDTEMLSWPSVLSVSALLPAPVSLAPTDEQLSFLLPEDASEGDWIPLHHAEQARHQGDTRSESVQQKDDSPAPAREAAGTASDTDISPPVLRLRKGGGSLSELRETCGVESKPVHTSDAELRCVLRVLLLLWLLLYCWWILPQIDLKTLPDLLFNLQH